MTQTAIPSVRGIAQPPVTTEQLAQASGSLIRYRIMAFVTGVVLISGCVALIIKYGTSVHAEPVTGLLWVAHGWLFLIYVISTAMLGFKLRWPLARYAIVMVAGTIPTMSFVAEHFVTRATKRAASQPATRPENQPATRPENQPATRPENQPADQPAEDA